MNITLYFPPSSVQKFDKFREFIVETSSLLARKHSEHKFIIITDQRSPVEQFPSYSNMETFVLNPVPKIGIFKKLWLNAKLLAFLKKAKTDLFISFDNFCPQMTSIPICLFIQDIEIKNGNLKKARLLMVTNNLIKRELIEKYGMSEKKIAVIYPPANKIFGPVIEEKKATLKNKYSDSREFYLFNSFFPKQQDFIHLLKSFSHFKKRQQSNFKLLITTPMNSFFENVLADYKYRSDVKFVDTNDIQEQKLITGSAYAVVLPFSITDHMIAALNAMKAGVPVITLKNSVINELTDDAALYAETGTAKDIGEKIIQVYTDENYRSRLIEKGKEVAANYTDEKAAETLWQSILNVLE